MKKTRNFTVSEEFQSYRLDKFLSANSDESRSFFEKLIADGKVQINGKTISKSSAVLQTEDIVDLTLPEPTPTTLDKWDYPLNIVFEDEHLIIVDKPAGMVVHPSAGHADKTLVNALLNHCDQLAIGLLEQRPGIVHRIDRDTSGLLVIAKTNSVLQGLQADFKARKISRIYKCLVFGETKTETRKIESFLARHPKDRKKYSSVRNERGQIIRDPNEEPIGSKYAVTEYERLEYFPQNVSYLKVKLGTGRTHQIRVHLSEIGHRVLGDSIYGNINTPNSKLGKIERELGRIALQAFSLGFTHPATEESLHFEASWPEDLKSLTDHLNPERDFEF